MEFGGRILAECSSIYRGQIASLRIAEIFEFYHLKFEGFVSACSCSPISMPGWAALDCKTLSSGKSLQ